MGRVQSMVLIAVLALVVGACNRGEDESVPTTAVPSTGVGAEGSSTTSSSTSTSAAPSTEESSVATTTAVIVGIPTYEVVSAVEAEGGDALVVVVEPGSFTNVELENLVFDIVDRFAPSSAIVVDLQEAADLAILEELSDEQEMVLSQHTLITIDNGVEVTFLGPYADIPGLIVGS